MKIEEITAYHRCSDGNTGIEPYKFTKISSGKSVLFAQADYDLKWNGDENDVLPKTNFFNLEEFNKLYSIKIIGWELTERGWNFTKDRK